MANVKITELTAITAPASSDVLAIVDVDADVTKKVTIANLVGSAAPGSFGAPSFGFADDDDTGMYRAAADQLGFATTGAERFRIDDAGNLHISGDSKYLYLSSDDNQWIRGDASTDFIQFGTSNSERVRIDSSGQLDVASGIIGDNVSDNFTLNGKTQPFYGFSLSGAGNQPSGFSGYYGIAFASNGSERMRIDSSGNVLIGTTASRGTPLDVAGTLFVGETDNNSDKRGYIYCSQYSSSSEPEGFTVIAPFSDSGDNRVSIGGSATAANAATQIRFYTASNTFTKTGTERARIDSSGRLLIGTNSSNDIFQESQLQIEGNTSATASLSLHQNQTSVDGPQLILGKSRGSGSVGSSDILGDIVFAGNDGTDVNSRGAIIRARIDGTPGSNDLPTHLAFFTTPDGASSPTERLRINSSGNVGIGQTSPAQLLHLTSSGSNAFLQFSDSGSGGSAAQARIGSSGNDLVILNNTSSNTATERMRINSSGRVGIGTSSPSSELQVNGDSDTQIRVVCSSGGSAGIQFGDTGDVVRGGVNFDATGNNLTLRGHNNTERMRIDSNGNVGIGVTSIGNIANRSQLVIGGSDGGLMDFLVGSATEGRIFANNANFIIRAAQSDGDLVFQTGGGYEKVRIFDNGTIVFDGSGSASSSSSGSQFYYRDDHIYISNSADIPFYVNRNSNDGQLVQFRQANAQEGNISVSGSTVSYNGAHLARWSQLPGGAERTEILRGSVLSNLDEMCEWGDEDNEQLNRMQVSSVEGDPNVAGVFQAWDDDDDTYANDFYCAMTGDFVIRIAQGTTVARGDLLMSAGDGTAKTQDDDIVRSKTIAKVTSTTVSETYSDGSYCVPCVLMAC